MQGGTRANRYIGDLVMTKATSSRRLANSRCDLTRFNALRHGLLSRFAVLPGEDETQYSDLLNALVAEHKPLGPTEEHLVEELAGIIWRKRRLRLAEGAVWRRGLTGAPSRETTEAALAPLNLFEKEAANVGKQRADLAQDGASIAHALELLHAGKTRCYDKALSNLGETTRERWDEATRSKPPIELFDFSSPSFSQDADGLLQFLQTQARSCEARRKELENQPLIRDQVFGEALDPVRLEGLNRYEVHLDRKLERMLTMLIRLQDLRRVSSVNPT
jgi:hypothetical protein